MYVELSLEWQLSWEHDVDRLSPMFSCSSTPLPRSSPGTPLYPRRARSDLHHKFPCFPFDRLIPFISWRLHGRLFVCVKVSVVTAHQRRRKPRVKKRERGGKYRKLNISEVSRGQAHNWSRAQGRAATHPPRSSLYFPPSIYLHLPQSRRLWSCR